MAVTTIFTDMENIMLGPVESFVDSGVSGTAGYLAGPLQTAAVLYISLYGWFILKGTIQEPLMDFIFKCMKISIIVLLATKAGEYNTYVKDLFFKSLPDEIGSALNASYAGTSAFDSLIDKGLAASGAIWARAGVGPGIVLDAIICLMIIFVSAVVAVIGFIVGFYAKIGMSLTLAIGPIFIALALFDSTRKFTQSWLGQLANFVILQVLVVAVGSLILQSLIGMIDTASGLEEAMTALVTFIAICVCAAYIFYQLPAIASSLAAGGAALSYGFGASRDVKDGAPSQAGNAAYRGVKWAGGQASYWAGRGASKIGRNINS